MCPSHNPWTGNVMASGTHATASTHKLSLVAHAVGAASAIASDYTPMDRLLLQPHQAAVPAATHSHHFRQPTGWNIPAGVSQSLRLRDGVVKPRCPCTGRTHTKHVVCRAATAVQPEVLSSSDTDFAHGQQQALMEEEGGSSPVSSSSHMAATLEQGEAALGSSEEQLDEREQQRRARISAANTGKVPWNLGRKHSPETIAKIKERTRAAMSRPDVVQAYKEGVTKHLAARAELAKLNPKPEKPEKPPKPPREPKVATARRKAAEQAGDQDWEGETAMPHGRPKTAQAEQSVAGESPQGEAAGSAAGGAVAAAAAAAGPQKRRSRAKTPAGDTSAEPEAPKIPKKRAPPTEEHKAAIRAAIRAKWQDPEYRAKTVGGMHDHIRTSKGIEPGTSRSSEQRKAAAANRARRRAAEGTSSSRASSSSSSGSRKRSTKSIAQQEQQAEIQARKEWLLQAQARAQAVIDMRYKIERLKMKMEEVRLEASGAFANDSRMANRTVMSLADSEQLLALALQKLRELESQIPPGMIIRQGRVEGRWEAAIADEAKLFAAMPGRATQAGGASTEDASARKAPAGEAPARSAQAREATAHQATSRAAPVRGFGDGVSQQTASGLVVPMTSGPAAAAAALAELDPPIMQSPLYATPGLLHGQANGNANGVHVNGHAKVNGTHHPHANGHSVNGLSASVGVQLLDKLSAEQLLAGSGNSLSPKPETDFSLPQQVVHQGSEANNPSIADINDAASEPGTSTNSSAKPRMVSSSSVRAGSRSSAAGSTAVVSSSQQPPADEEGFIRSTRSSRRRPSH